MSKRSSGGRAAVPENVPLLPPLPRAPEPPRWWIPRIIIVIILITVAGIWTPAQLVVVLSALTAIVALLSPQERAA